MNTIINSIKEDFYFTYLHQENKKHRYLLKHNNNQLQLALNYYPMVKAKELANSKTKKCTLEAW